MNIKKLITGLLTSATLLTGFQMQAQDLPPIPKAEPAAPKNWHALDLATDGYFGISLSKAYGFLKGKRSKQVTVATIDSGVDTLQKDLKDILWTNTKEIPGNGKDDDHNGYIDDVHGWNFLGGAGAKCDFNETTEEVREYARLKDKWMLARPSSPNDKAYKYWLRVQAVHDSTVFKSRTEYDQLSPVMNILVGTSVFVKRELHMGPNDVFTLKDLDRITTTNDTVKECKNVWASFFTQEGPDSDNAKVIKDLNEYLTKLNNDLNPDLEARKNIVGDNPDVYADKPGYGNNLLKWQDAMHGTMVAGFIAAKRNNGYGIDGVADNVRIMAIKAVPNGDEYDKDIAHAIRYAVDNGAQIINMSFGKKISPHKQWVDDAMRYAAQHDVLMVQAAGNDNANLDKEPSFPNTTADDGRPIGISLIDVGASTARKGENLAADFSNYGKNTVDVFAPGAKVTSVTNDGDIETEDGTSFASPITAGIAALILEYYPSLSARQIKAAILQSAKPLTGLMVNLPGDKDKKVDFTTLSRTGGIVNAYDALVAASKMKGERKVSSLKNADSARK
ncbi:subtilase family protein [Mucilaginibacter yixingensis]|uniref:Subtilase family protein n=1 Tax=Mucilaginibacter yixingensis TaxID=1295612 RepID=A0A2T5JCT7_9SPHI|nr:S8 family serine peptidase [Mucilaginibacter yixingensis]PTQ99573.1 subtilase family protein [Mucilaginibacter yixingensis]